MPDSGKIRVLFSVTNCICFDQRVQKMAGVLEEMGMDITIAGRWKGECCKKYPVPFRTVRFRMLFNRGFLFYKFFNIRLLFYILFHRFDLMVANDLDTLPASYLGSVLKRIPLVYDSHEYFTGLPELKNRNFVRSVWKAFEKAIFPHLRYIITVSEPIADLYENEYSKRPVVIRNFAPLSEKIEKYNRTELNIPGKDFVLIIQGTGINIDKGCEEAVEAVAGTDNVTLIIAGGGDILPDVRKLVQEYKIEKKVIFLPPKPWKELMQYTKMADAGLVLEKNTNLNYRYSLPNKLFDYISAGIPVISSDLPETSAIITKYNCGIIIPNVTPREIHEAIGFLGQNRILYKELKNNSLVASDELNWENESVKVREFYSLIINNEPLLKTKATINGE